MRKGKIVKDGFVKTSDAEAKKEHSQYIDSQKREMVNDGYELHFTYLQLRNQEARIKSKDFKLSQELPDHERFEIATERDILAYGFNRLLLELGNLQEKMNKVYKLDKKDITDLTIGKFDFSKWNSIQMVVPITGVKNDEEESGKQEGSQAKID